ncbi:ATPase, T2SS/T4P/T4SS family [Thermaerobacter subterraneus]|uniref:Type II secretory pathway, ATPase PulE/Tfp pilus assembly pathway, ATPase PilB n=1 Tax=Thermaerobacter subterraneus DSM 13965 TaxID=867903 RepID=K6NZ61_9FIRM|nr:ATPase, T2SS/T4P/T4SS family [Thermaerobacter subterraneus]EKP94155.1 type II secretory pathway, ATPase PulE/Tfp pilus assembly pathway, ATPase PilB [Thermaerobacter subterraneus DSM 13965]
MARWLFRGQLGDYLVERGWITPDQLQAALEEQRRTGRRLGQILLRHGWITRAQLQEALAAQLAVRVWDLRRNPPDPAVARRVPDWVARRYQVLPVDDDGRRLVVAMADPTDLEALDQVRLVTGRDVEPVLADEDEIKAAVGRIFGLLEVAERALRATRGDVGERPPRGEPAWDEPASPAGCEGEGPGGAAGEAGGEGFRGVGARGEIVAAPSGTASGEANRYRDKPGADPAAWASGGVAREPSGMDSDGGAPHDARGAATGHGLGTAPATGVPGRVGSAGSSGVAGSGAAMRWAGFPGSAGASPRDRRGDGDRTGGPGQGPVRPEQVVATEAQAPVVEFVQNLLEQAVRQKASDVHLEPGDGTFTIRFRIDGTLHVAMRPPAALHAAVTTRIKVLAGMDIAERRLPQDGRFRIVVEGREFDCRCSTMPTVHGEKVVIRLLDRAMGGARLDALGLPDGMVEQLRELVRRPYGLLLVTGPTGSGKSTTLAALLREIDRTRLNVLTIEDPVEYEIPGASQSQVNPRAGLTFEVALRHFLRQDPDVIMVGEIRDRETADTAVRAALTGHLILSTLHTNDAPSSVTRLVDMGIEPFLLGSSLLAVLAQRLVRVLCPHCRQPYEPGEGVRAVFAGAGVALPESGLLYRPGGCPECRGGYAGRQAVAELMVMNPELRELVTRGATAAELGRRAAAAGMRTLRQAGLELVLAGVTSVEEVLRVTETPGWEKAVSSAAQAGAVSQVAAASWDAGMSPAGAASQAAQSSRAVPGRLPGE